MTSPSQINHRSGKEILPYWKSTEYLIRTGIIALVLFLAVEAASAADSQAVSRDLSSQLQRYGPGNPESDQRKTALLNLHGFFMNDTLEVPREITKGFISTALSEIAGSSTPTPSVWYIWNMGYVVKTRNYILGFDLPEVLLQPLNEEQIGLLAQSVDFFFVSHMDKPHRDLDIVSEMRSSSSVVCPQEVVESFDLVADRECEVIGMEAGGKLNLQGVQISAYPGDDGRGTPMRCFLVQCDDLQVLHLGDQHYVEDWMQGLAPDVLMIGPLEEFSWVTQAIEAVKADYILPGGFYDMSHPKNTWDGYPYAYDLRNSTDLEVIPLFFGERFKPARPSGDAPFPYLIGFLAVILVGGIGGLLIYHRYPGGQREEGKMKKEEMKKEETASCQKRYVEKLCLTCKHYSLKGGRPFCRKYGFYLQED